MASNSDPLGYYAVLGVKLSASPDQIKKAFRAKAQQFHPDRNPSPEATRQFQSLNRAYQILSDTDSRAEYDANSYLHIDDMEAQKQSSHSMAPIVCCVCGKVSAQPRYVIYHQVISFVVATLRRVHQGVYCASCGARRAYKNSAVTWLLGWWGIPSGPIYSARALMRNMLGGEQPALSNFRAIGMQAGYFASNGQMDVARLLADQAFEFVKKIPEFNNGQESAADRDLKTLLTTIQSVTETPSRPLKKSWGVRSKSFTLQASATGLVALMALVILISIQRTNSMESTHIGHPARGTESTVTGQASANGFTTEPDYDAQKYGLTISDKPPGLNQSEPTPPAAAAAPSSDIPEGFEIDTAPPTVKPPAPARLGAGTPKGPPLLPSRRAPRVTDPLMRRPVPDRRGDDALDRMLDDMLAARPTSRAASPELPLGYVLGNTPASRNERRDRFAFSEPAQPLPRTGVVQTMWLNRSHEKMAPLKIVAAARSPNYYVKLVDWNSNAAVAFFFIQSGEVLSVDIPLGRYGLRFASGETWYGNQYYFGPDTTYRRADARFEFRREGDELLGHSIELIKQITGNLRQVEINRVDF